MTMKPKKAYIKGTPEECGAQLFELCVLPALASTKGYPPHEIAHFYNGLVGAILGAMAADFGHPRAVELAQIIVDQFAAMADEFTSVTH